MQRRSSLKKGVKAPSVASSMLQTGFQPAVSALSCAAVLSLERRLSKDCFMQETFGKLLKSGKTKEDIHAALKAQCVDLVFTAHPTQAVRRYVSWMDCVCDAAGNESSGPTL